MAVMPTPKWGPKDPYEYNHFKKEPVSPPNPFSLLNPFFNSWTIGFNEQLRLLESLRSNTKVSSSTYPPYNIKDLGNNSYEIEVAVAGFSKSDLTIELEKKALHTLTIKGAQDEQEHKYVHKGLASRDFSYTFTLAEHVEVKSASLVDGILKVFLELEIPEDLKPTIIKIK